VPAGAACNASFQGMTAVCWDNVNYRNYIVGGVFCTYKNMPAASCTGGGNPGYMYECVYE